MRRRRRQATEVTQDEIVIAFALVASLDPNEYKHTVAKAVILKAQAWMETNKEENCYGDMLKADRVMAFIDANPEKHDQDQWLRHIGANDHDPLDPATNYCGTTGCIAGWAVAFELDDLDAKPSWDNVGDRQYADCVVVDGSLKLVEDVAQDILELSNAQAGYIFNSNRTLDEIREAFEAIRLDSFWSPGEWDDM